MVGSPSIENELSELKRLGLVGERRQCAYAGEREIELRQTGVTEIVLDSQDVAQLQELHRRAAQWLDNWAGQPPPEHDAQLAHHYAAAGDLQRAAQKYLDSANEALRGYANREAWERFSVAAATAATAAANAEQNEIWQRALLGVAEVGTQIGELQAAVDAANLVIAHTTMTTTIHCRALCARGDAEQMSGKYLDAVADFSEAYNVAMDGMHRSRDGISAASRHAMVLFKIGRRDESRQIAEMTLARWKEEPRPVLARALGRLEIVLGHLDSQALSFESALAHYAAAAKHFERGEDRVGQAMAELSQSNVAYRNKQFESAEGHYRAVATRCRNIDYIHGAVMAETNLGNVLLDVGRAQDALPVLKNAESTARQTGVVTTLPETLRLIAACHLALGDLVMARLNARESAELALASDNAPQREAAEAMLASIGE